MPPLLKMVRAGDRLALGGDLHSGPEAIGPLGRPTNGLLEQQASSRYVAWAGPGPGVGQREHKHPHRRGLGDTMVSKIRAQVPLGLLPPSTGPEREVTCPGHIAKSTTESALRSPSANLIPSSEAGMSLEVGAVLWLSYQLPCLPSPSRPVLGKKTRHGTTSALAREVPCACSTSFPPACTSSCVSTPAQVYRLFRKLGTNALGESLTSSLSCNVGIMKNLLFIRKNFSLSMRVLNLTGNN